MYTPASAAKSQTVLKFTNSASAARGIMESDRAPRHRRPIIFIMARRNATNAAAPHRPRYGRPMKTAASEEIDQNRTRPAGPAIAKATGQRKIATLRRRRCAGGGAAGGCTSSEVMAGKL